VTLLSSVCSGGRKLLLDWARGSDPAYELRVRRSCSGPGAQLQQFEWSRAIDISNVGIAALTLRCNGVISQLIKVDVSLVALCRARPNWTGPDPTRSHRPLH
jgi:hypothetical protein